MTQDALARLLALAEKGKHERDIGYIMASSEMKLDYEVVAALVRVVMATRAYLDCDSTEESDERCDEIDATLAALDAALAKGTP